MGKSHISCGNSLAFWASRPIQPLVLLSAKLCIVLGVLVVVPLVGLVVVLRSYALTAGELVSLLARPYDFLSWAYSTHASGGKHATLMEDPTDALVAIEHARTPRR